MRNINITLKNDLECFDELSKKYPKEENYRRMINLYREETELMQKVVRNFCKKQKVRSLLNDEKGEIVGYGLGKDGRPIYMVSLDNSLKTIEIPVENIEKSGFEFID